MSISRRKFLRSGAVCALTAGALLRHPVVALGQRVAPPNPARDFQLPFEATTNPVFYFSRGTFEPYLGGVFSARGAGGKTVQLQLAAIDEYAPSANTKLCTKSHRRTNCFSLQFTADRQLNELTTLHKMEHGALGGFDLFMTHNEVGGTHFYRAVINHAA